MKKIKLVFPIFLVVFAAILFFTYSRATEILTEKSLACFQASNLDKEIATGLNTSDIANFFFSIFMLTYVGSVLFIAGLIASVITALIFTKRNKNHRQPT
jgi:hypothetical protein